MKNINTAILFYALAIITTIFGNFFENDIIVLIAKPVIIPAIFFYYLQTSRVRVNWMFVLVLLFNFISDMMELFAHMDFIYYILFLNCVNYFILSYFVIKDMSFSNMDNKKLGYIFLVFIFIYSILYIMLDLIDVGADYWIYFIYGFVLSTLASLVGINFFILNNFQYTYAAIMTGCFIFSDIFYALYNFYVKLDAFHLMNMLLQFISYYYMVRYFTVKKEKVKLS